MPTTNPSIVEFQEVSKSLGGTEVLKGVTFSISQGDVHALLGENGAGKSTLMKILGGLLHADSGSLRLKDRAVNFKGTKEAWADGVGMLGQNSGLIPSLTVKENLLLGDPDTDFLLGNHRIHSGTWEDMLSGIRLDDQAYSLSRSERQRVEIYRLLSKGADVLILDEPTAVLSPIEGEALFKKLLALKDEGKTIIFVTHKLAEVEKYADAVTVLREGRHVSTLSVTSTSPSSLATLMVGGDLPPETTAAQIAEGGPVVLSVRGLSLEDGRHGERQLLIDVSFDVRAGECIGIAGVNGNGQKELVAALTGKCSDYRGDIEFRGRAIVPNDHAEFAYIPDNARETAVGLGLSVLENVMLKDFRNPPFAKHGILQSSELAAEAHARLEAFQVRHPGLDSLASQLSGGNLQRLILARELGRMPDLILAVDPTAGLDIKGIAAVHAYIRQKVVDGCAVLLVSSDLDEVFALSDRILTMSRGRNMGVLPRNLAKMNTIGQMMGGVEAEVAPPTRTSTLGVN